MTGLQALGRIVDRVGEHSSEDLRSAVAARMRELRALGCAEGHVVALVQPNEASFFVNLLAAWELGACVVPLSPLAPAAESARALEHSGATIVCDHGTIGARTGGGKRPPAGTALLLYTSGSTGAPRGVALSFEAVRKKVETLQAVLPPETLARTLCLLPLSFGHGLIGIALPALLGGHELHLRPAFDAATTAKLGELLDTKKITFFSSVPALWATTLPFADPPRGESLRAVFCASSPLTVAAWREAKQWLGESVDFRNVYGLTEAASWISALPEGAAYEEFGEVGPGWNAEFRLDGEEVLVRAPYLMTGYHGDPAGTAAAFADGWLRTGDTGTLGAKGLRLTGRLKDQINRAGLKVSPTEVEQRLREHPGVHDCCVFGVPDEVSGELVAAAVVARGQAPTAKELREHCRAALSEFKVPEKLFFVSSLPRDGRGKVSRAELRKLAEAK